MYPTARTQRPTKDKTVPSLLQAGRAPEGVGDNVEQVHAWILAEAARQGRALGDIFGPAIRQAIDEVIDGARTGRWSMGQLEKTEKIYIGTKIEIVVRSALNLELRKPLDTWIADVPVDIKWSGTCSWEIPSEAVDQICLVVGSDRPCNSYFVGLIRCTDDCLSAGKNKDGKRKLSALGRQKIRWLLKGAPLPRNFIEDLPDDIRKRIMKPQKGQARVRELVALVQRQPIPRTAIETVAQQRDPMRRLRRDQGKRLGGLVVLSKRYGSRVAEQLGLPPLKEDEFISVKQEEIDALRS